jgi:hypothetical protein|tara:strand:- start:19428 stop:19673 length:246 start_codon:yes stop_codon:yes gene_type:complete
MSRLIDMLTKTAEADKAKALLSLDLLNNKAAGIGDHSTLDFYNNAEEALAMLVEADDRLAALIRYFPQHSGPGGPRETING